MLLFFRFDHFLDIKIHSVLKQCLRNLQFIKTRYFSRNLSISCSIQVPCFDKLKIVHNTVIKTNGQKLWKTNRWFFKTPQFPSEISWSLPTSKKISLHDYTEKKGCNSLFNGGISCITFYQVDNDYLMTALLIIMTSVVEYQYWV